MRLFCTWGLSPSTDRAPEECAVKPAIGPIHHLAVLVEDLAGAEAFYSGVLGLEIEKRWPDDAGGTRSIWLALGNGARLMLERATTGDARRASMGAGWHLLALTIRKEDRAAIESALLTAGIAVDSRSENTLYFRDPEGNRLALSHYPSEK